MARTGRPRKEINEKLFENLCAIQCTEKEICSVLECCEDTLNAWCKRTYKMTFSDAYKNKSQLGKSSLRRAQFRLAEKNATMAIFLGKQFLGQRDSVDVAVTDAKGIALDELEKMVMQNDADTSGGTADT